MDTVQKIITLNKGNNDNLENYLDLTCNRPGQDIRYALNDDKLRNLGWKPQMEFDKALPGIVEYYKNKFIW